VGNVKTCGEIAAWFDREWPEDLAESWDNVGLLAGRADKEVHIVYVALDATEKVIEAAVRAGADMLVTHHPLIFGGVKHVSDQDALGRCRTTNRSVNSSVYKQLRRK
jgi:putative NIF3 family GTP cyclohydrolase 1 type 2